MPWCWGEGWQMPATHQSTVCRRRRLWETSSQRRLAQLKHLRNDLVFQDLRGNVDTRLRKLDEGQYDALVLAWSGLRRLGLEHRISSALASEAMLPSPGQGALAIETRAEDQDTIEAVKDLDHKFTRLACTAERAFCAALVVVANCRSLPTQQFATRTSGLMG